MGATGQVFIGTLGRELIAVKRLKTAGVIDRTDLRRRFDEEVRVLSRVVHPRVVRLLGHGVCADSRSDVPFAIAQEYLEGGVLADWLRGRDGSSPARAWRGGSGLPALLRLDISIGAGVGLAYLHGHREPGERGSAAPVMHCDVKSANVGLAMAGDILYAKILDCGLAKAIKGNDTSLGVSSTSGFAGTPGYMADEVARLEYTIASEVFSFGVVLLEVLTGQCVNADTVYNAREVGEDGGVAAVAELADRGVWPLVAADALAALVFDCIAARPACRPSGMGSVLDRLRAMRSLVATPPPVLLRCASCDEDVPAYSGSVTSGGGFVCFGCMLAPASARLSVMLCPRVDVGATDDDAMADLL